MDGARVLVVEDEFLIRLSLVEALTDDGFVVIEAGSGHEALQLAREERDIALVLTDLQLPGGMDGWSLAARLRQDRPELPVIFVTGRPDANVAALRPQDRVIGKPYQLRDVCAAAREMCAAARGMAIRASAQGDAS